MLPSAATNAPASVANTDAIGSGNLPKRKRSSIRWDIDGFRMSTWALIPIKPRASCKTRLASILAPDHRIAVVRALLRHVLSTLRATPGIDRIALVSSERDGVPDD